MVKHKVPYVFDLKEFLVDVRMEMVRRGCNQDDVCAELDIWNSTLSRLFNGKSPRPSLDVVVRLAVWASLDLGDYVFD